MSIPQNRESREWYSAEGLLFRRQIEERNGLTIDSCEFLQFDVVDTAFAQFALGDERSALAHFRANLTLTQASLFAPVSVDGKNPCKLPDTHDLVGSHHEVYSPVD
jgi:hypothetical protein